MNNYWSDVFGGAKSLLVGLTITGRQFCKPVVTEMYPWETPKLPERFRGHIELTRNEKTGLAACIACGMCMRACPSNCIKVAGKKPEGSKKKIVTKYILDFTTCSLCGSCIESCKFKAIRFSADYNLASPRKENYIFDLVQRLEDQA